MILKILNLNLWNYSQYETRKPRILEFIREQNPDVITLQEVRDDIQFNKKGDNQAMQLNRELNYPHYEFYEVTDKQKERPEKYTHRCKEGTAILSKFPIVKFEKRELKRQPEDRYTCGNLYVQLKAEKMVDMVIVHFSNSDLFSLLHLIETLKWIKKKGIDPIIAGDFNIRHPDWLDDLTEDHYTSSMRHKPYISYSPDNYTLDYILIPQRFKFKSFDCLGEGLSDHKALVAEVKI